MCGQVYELDYYYTCEKLSFRPGLRMTEGETAGWKGLNRGGGSNQSSSFGRTTFTYNNGVVFFSGTKAGGWPISDHLDQLS